MILYFNSKITSENLTQDYTRGDYFFPIVYPKKNINAISKYRVLCDTLSTYSVINFSKVIINIEIDNITVEEQAEFKLFIKGLFKSENLTLFFTRPSTLNTWIKDIESYKTILDFNEPVLVVMNHDHPFVDYQVYTFSNCIKNIFKPDVSNKYKVFYYSHSPEICEWVINGRGKVFFHKINHGLYLSSEINDWIDSIVIMTFETLLHIFKSAIYNSNEYIGRIDWPGIKYKKLSLKGYAFCREFFRHYDGYNHITGLRLFEEFKPDELPKTKFVEKKSAEELLDFYYSMWRINFLLALKSKLKNTFFWNISKKDVLIDFIEETFQIFEESYLNQDLICGLINSDEKAILNLGLRNRVYYNANLIYGEVSLDINIEKPSYYKQLKNLIEVKKLISVKRNKFIVITGISTLFIKLVTIGISFITIPMTLNYLGNERYGILLTLTTALSLMTFADFGLGNNLINEVSKGYAENDELYLKKSISSTYFLVLFISLLFILLVVLLLPFLREIIISKINTKIDHTEVFNTFLVIIFSILCNMPLGIVQKVYDGFQESYVYQVFLFFSSILSISVLLLFINLKLGLPFLALAFSSTSIIANIFAGGYLFLLKKTNIRPQLK